MWLDRARAHLKSNKLLPEISDLPTHTLQRCSEPLKSDGTFAVKFTVAYISSY